MIRWSLILLVVIVGCGVNAEPSKPNDQNQTPVVNTFDEAAFRDELAHQAELAGKMASVDAGLELDSILNQAAEDPTIPKDVIQKIRNDCPAIGGKGDLSDDQIKAIRGK